MNMDKLMMVDATDEQVRSFARTFLQLDGADALAIKPLRTKVTEVWPQDFIWMARSPEPIQITQPTGAAPTILVDVKAAGAGIAASSSRTDPVVVLTIQKVAGPGGSDPVYLNVNGSAMHVARGKPQKVPYRYFEDLKHTVQRIVDQDERSGVIRSEDVQRFPLMVHEMPTEDEIFEFFRLDALRSNQVLKREDFDARRAKNAAAEAASARRDERDRETTAATA